MPTPGDLAALLLVAGLAGCGASDDVTGPTEPVDQTPVPGTLSVTTATSGFLQDDSYDLLVNGEVVGTIGANDGMTVSELEPATYDVGLGDVADNCAVETSSVDVVSDGTTDAVLDVVCAPADPTTYTIRFTRDRPDLETGELTDCIFGLCPAEADAWDLYVHANTQSDPQSVIRQNQSTGAEIAHLPGVTLEGLTEADVAGAAFTTELVAEAFDPGRVILLRTAAGNVYVLANPVEDTFAQTLTFDVVLLSGS